MLKYDDLVGYFQSGCKPRSDFRFGIEWEQFSYNKSTGKPLPYYGDISILSLLNKLIADYGWSPYYEGEVIIALKRKVANGTSQFLSLEPGGQVELSGALQKTVDDVRDELNTYYHELVTAGDALGIGFKAIGFTPDWTRDDFHLMPKQRYKIMTEYMPKKGNLGLDMMFRTCTIQVNMDYESEMDMINKMRVAIALQPLSTAIFANSRIKEGVDTGYASYRSHIWTDTDPDRTGMLDFVFDDDFGFCRYTDYMLNVPMYFVRRNGKYIDASGLSFRDFMRGELPVLMGEYPTLDDWIDHVSTAFPEVRLKSFIEMRGADSVPLERVADLADFWDKMIYNPDMLNKILAIIQKWDINLMKKMRNDVPRQGFLTQTPDGRNLRAFYDDLLKLL